MKLLHILSLVALFGRHVEEVIVYSVGRGSIWEKIYSVARGASWKEYR